MRVIALGTGRPFVRRGAGQLLLADRARQRRQVHHGFRLGLAGEFHRARNLRTRTSPPISRPTCMPIMSATSRRCGSGAGPAAASSRWCFTAHRVQSRSTAPSISCGTRWNRWCGIPTRGSDCCPTPAPRSRSMSSIIKQTGVVYDRNGVVIKSFPAIHIYDGPVSYRLEWNGLCFVFSGDTTPSQFFVDNAQGRRPADPRMLQHGEAADRALGLSREERDRHRHHGAHRAGGMRQGARAGEAAPGRGVPFLQRLRHRARDRARDPQALPGPAGAGAGPDGVQRDQGRRSGPGWR